MPLLLSALLAVSSYAAAAPARGPYIVDASSTAAKVCWRDAAGRDACSAYDGLEPGAGFNYTIPAREGSWSARTLPPVGKPLRFAVFGDSGRGGKKQRQVAKAVERWAPDLVLLAGDIVYPAGADADYDGGFFSPYARLLPKLPFFPAPGNHDYGNSREASAGRKRWSEGYARVFRRWPYYSFDAGNAHVAVVDSNREGFGILAAPSLADGSTQRDWLERDLKASKARWKFVILHVPPYSSGEHGSSVALQRLLGPVFERHKVDVVFAGHDHHYERTHPVAGTVYFVVGTGGASLYTVDPREPWSAKTVVDHGFLGVTLDGGSAQFEFYDAAGILRDSARLQK
ncbi:MAG: metallophosphoesterase [Elusimicrobia bacterium]|nr:metallophosphoesterase [Elusimicrobiota bacterium]